MDWAAEAESDLPEFNPEAVQAGSEDFLPDPVKEFLQHFQQQLKSNQTDVVHTLYVKDFNEISNKYYKNSPWPSTEKIKDIVAKDELFLVLYKEMTFRHLYTKLQQNLTQQQRVESFDNYTAFFDYVLKSEDLSIDLPNVWLWDIIDEYIYQYQSFCQYRTKLKGKTQSELQFLSKNKHVWDTKTVLTTLETLVQKSDIVKVLESEVTENKSIDEALKPGKKHLRRMLGYFAMIGLLRVHSLLGDYENALKSIAPIDLGKKGVFTEIIACHISLFYYVGFAYMMLKRYDDAIWAFTTILTHIARVKQFQPRTYQYDVITKKHDQLLALLAIVICLHPKTIDKTVRNTVFEKYGDKISRMQKGEESVYEELFKYACPKFVVPSIPDYENLKDSTAQAALHQEAYKQQVTPFLKEVKQQKELNTLRSYLKLYSTVPLQKLASFLEIDVNTLNTRLTNLKNKSKQLKWKGGPALSGEWEDTLDIEFVVDKDNVVHVTEVSRTQNFAKYFVEETKKFEQVLQALGK